MTSTRPASPYVGLRPFQETDSAIFFGRDRDTRVIAANLETRPLTVLYGASGVGKSSVLQAGVAHRLKQQPGTSVLYYRDWQSNSLLQEIIHKASEFVPEDVSKGRQNSAELSSQPTSLARRDFLILDQFEEFLLYHAYDSLGGEFDSVLSRIINRKDCPVNVLIGIRDDSLFKLDRHFSLRIPNLLRDPLVLERMTPQGAKSAIEQPLAIFSKNGDDGKVYEIEPGLVSEILGQVQAGNIFVGESSGIGRRPGRPKDDRIETAYLQLVLTKLWEEERSLNSVTLRLQTLRALGGANNIVKSHVNSVMNHLANNRERDIAANMFRYLVTPSRSKIAQATKDLVSYAERPESEVTHVLEELTDRSESRILRRISDPEQYEIFHDVLAQPLLDWRRAHAEALATRHFWRMMTTATVIVVLFAIVTAYALIQRHRAKESAERASSNWALSHETSKKLNGVLQDQQNTLKALQAAQSKGEGNEDEVAELKAQLQQYSNKAQAISQTYQQQSQPRDAYSTQALQNLTAVQKERDDYKSRLDAAQQQIKELQKASK